MLTLSKCTISLALAVTAAVTFSEGWHARAQTVGSYAPVITNLDTGKHVSWGTTFPDQNRCDAYLGNLPDRLAAIANPDPAVKVADQVGGDPAIVNATEQLVIRIYTATGKLPRLSLSCELTGDPA